MMGLDNVSTCNRYMNTHYGDMLHNPLNKRSTRKGFTLTEMLVATTVFMIGFVAVYGLFLAGTRYRRIAETETSLSLAAGSLIAQWRLTVGRENGSTQYAPSEYVGDGDPTNGPEDEFFHYPDNPTIWYRVHACTDLTGNRTTTNSLTIRMDIRFLDLGISPLDMPLVNNKPAIPIIDSGAIIDVDRKYRALTDFQQSTLPTLSQQDVDYYNQTLTTDEERILFILEKRGLLHIQEAVIVRHSS